MKETHVIRDLDQLRLLSDPLKLRLLQAFADSAKTTKQVAAELGEGVTKLYRHVDALQETGLIEVVEERQKRGAIERTFRAVARRFEADPSLFGDATKKEVVGAARDVLRVAETEILNALTHARDDDEPAIVMRIRGRASPEKVAELRTALQEWLDSVARCDPAPAEDTEGIGGLVAFYRID